MPNHAVMVMAWAHAPDDFQRALMIANTAGWDTDCNAANVGSVMGLVVGLEGINRDYDFQSPFADVAPRAHKIRNYSKPIHIPGLSPDAFGSNIAQYQSAARGSRRAAASSHAG